jgi:hypothetical protein
MQDHGTEHEIARSKRVDRHGVAHHWPHVFDAEAFATAFQRFDAHLGVIDRDNIGAQLREGERGITVAATDVEDRFALQVAEIADRRPDRDSNLLGGSSDAVGILCVELVPKCSRAVALAPWTVSPNNNFSKDKVPTAILVGSADTIAPPAQFGTVFYNSLPSSTKKLEGIISGETHFFVQENPPNQPGSYVQIAWIKRFADSDTRFSQFLNGDSRFTTFSSNGPF